MAWTLLGTPAKVVGTGQDNAISSPSRNWAGADLVLFVVGFYLGTPTASNISDGTNTYSLLTLQGASSLPDIKVGVYYKISPTFDGTDVIVFTPSAGSAGLYPSGIGYAWTCGGAPTLGTQVGNAAAGTSVQAGSLGNSGDLVFEAIATYVNSGSSINGGFSTPDENAYIGSTSIGSAGSWLEVSGAANPTWTLGGSNDTAAKAVSFVPPAGGGGGSAFPHYYYQQLRRRQQFGRRRAA